MVAYTIQYDAIDPILGEPKDFGIIKGRTSIETLFFEPL